MYSRSFGSIEADKQSENVISIPSDYHGSLYAKPEKNEAQEKTTAAPPPEEVPPKTRTESEHTGQSTGFFGNLLEKFTAEDIILFVLVFSLLREETDDPSSILAVILALLLL